jgi:hypothetical protein
MQRYANNGMHEMLLVSFDKSMHDRVGYIKCHFGGCSYVRLVPALCNVLGVNSALALEQVQLAN